MFKGFTAIAVFGIALAGGASAATVNLVQNGSFEDVSGLVKAGFNRTTHGQYSTLPGWQAGAGELIEIQHNTTLPMGTAKNPLVDAQDGLWYAELDAEKNSTMYQDVTFAQAGVYEFSFWYTPRTNTVNDNVIGYSLGGLFTDSVDGLYKNWQGEWQRLVHEFTVSAGEVLRLSFWAGGVSNGKGGFIDNVSIVGVLPAPIPLPASGLLLVGALAGTGVFAARRRKNAA